MSILKRNISSLSMGVVVSLYALAPFKVYSAELTFSGNTLPVLEETPDKSTGLDKIYVIYDIKDIDLHYISSNPSAVKILRYSNLGGGFAEPVRTEFENGEVIVRNPQGDMGYIIEDGDARYYYWIVNYLPHRFDIKNVSFNEDSDCDATYLSVEGSGDAIHYFTINGQQRTLNRDIEVEFTTQEWSEDSREFVHVETAKHFESLNNPLRITPPAYCSTSFKISGDKFLRQWNWISEAESSVFPPIAVEINTEAIQEEKSEDSSEDASSVGSNQITSGTDGLGGSAPADISFVAYATEGVLHHEWQLTSDPNFDNIDFRFNQQSIDYTFMEEGTYYMRYVGSNSDGSCDAVGDVYTINIGASELKCPNAFTPDGDGVNDEWKVSYRSLLEFKCWIFDRFGHQVFYFDDPTVGWDGKKNGKTVGSGVYYYVIQAVGADGKKYKKSGDINILRHVSGTSNSGATE